MTLNIDLKSPCVGVCSTVYGDDVCKGCKRYYDEVISWNAWELPKKQSVYDRLQQQMQQIIKHRLLQFNHQKLQAILNRHGIDASHFSCAYWQLYLLWVKKPDALSSWEVIDAELSEQDQHLCPNDFMNQIDDLLNQLAQQSFSSR